MKSLIFNKELFDKGNYGKLFHEVYEAMVKSGVIMSQEASIEVYKAIWLEGCEAGLTNGLNDMSGVPMHEVKTFEDLKKEL